MSETVRPAKDPGSGFRSLLDVHDQQSAEAQRKGKKKWLKVRKLVPDSDMSELVAFDEPQPGATDKSRRTSMILAAILIGAAFLAILDAALRRGFEELVPKSTFWETEVPPATDILEELEVELAAVRKVADDYFDAPTLEAQLAQVRDPSRVRPLMEGLRADPSRTPPGAPLRVGVEEAYFLDDPEGGAEFLMTRVEMGDYSQRLIAFGRTGEGPWKLDWESYVAHSSMPWDEFQRQRLAEPRRFRVLLGPSDYYNFEFADAEEFAAFKLSDFPETIVIHGYVPRGSPMEEELRSLLKNKGLICVMVDLRFPEGAESDHQVEIVNLAASSWIPGFEGASTAAYRLALPP